jgi:glycerol kinase
VLLAIDQGTTGTSEGVSDLLETPVEVAGELEATGLGAASLAGLAVGTWPDVAALERPREHGRRYEPQLDHDEALRLRGGWRAALARATAR